LSDVEGLPAVEGLPEGLRQKVVESNASLQREFARIAERRLLNVERWCLVGRYLSVDERGVLVPALEEMSKDWVFRSADSEDWRAAEDAALAEFVSAVGEQDATAWVLDLFDECAHELCLLWHVFSKIDAAS
jgi:hypothetical protein